MRLQALKIRAKRTKARRHIIDFAEYIYPGYQVGKHHRYIAECIERAVNREPGWQYLIFHAPPQHGKSLLCSKIFPTWYRGKFPDDPIMITAYIDSHAQSFSRFIRNNIQYPEYNVLFPNIKISQDSQSVQHWELEHPFRGELHAAGIMGGLTGKGAKLLIIDDPIKNREQAESKTYREKLIDEWKSTISTRLHDDCMVLLMQTRWHEQDLAGYLLKHDERPWKYIPLPALAEKGDVLGRKLHRPLWPDKFSQPYLLTQKKSIGMYDWCALYQGRPRPDEGSLFKRNWFQIIEHPPDDLRWVRFWDLATSKKTSADFTCSGRGAKDSEGNLYIDGVIHDRWEWPYVRKKIKATCLSEPDVFVGIESGGTQTGMYQEMMRDPDLVGLGILGISFHVDKRVRSTPVQTKAENGQIYLVRGEWNELFIEELVEFDQGEHDDYVDMISGIVKMLGFATAGLS
jgi:predicted phage terminase large subunit-like protein